MVEVMSDNVKQFNATIKDGKFVLFFGSKYCGPCKMLTKKFNQEFPDAKNILKIDSYISNSIVSEYGVVKVPTFMFMNNGEIEETIIDTLDIVDKTAKFINS